MWRARSLRPNRLAGMSSCPCTRPTNGMRLSCSFREDISPRSIPSGRSRTRHQLSTTVANRSWELRRNEGLDATFRDLSGAVFWKCADLAGPVDSDCGIPDSGADISLASRRRRLEVPCRSSRTTGFLGSHQIHSPAIRPEWLVPIHGRGSSRDLGTDWRRQLGPTAVHERLFQRTLHVLFRRSLRQARSLLRGVQKRIEFLSHRWSETDRRKEVGFPGSIPRSRNGG